MIFLACIFVLYILIKYIIEKYFWLHNFLCLYLLEIEKCLKICTEPKSLNYEIVFLLLLFFTYYLSEKDDLIKALKVKNLKEVIENFGRKCWFFQLKLISEHDWMTNTFHTKLNEQINHSQEENFCKKYNWLITHKM